MRNPTLLRSRYDLTLLRLREQYAEFVQRDGPDQVYPVGYGTGGTDLINIVSFAYDYDKDQA